VTYFQRGLLAAVLMLIGLVVWPFLAVGGLIAWTVCSDIRDEPERHRQQAKIKARLSEPITVADMRWSCESPAEEAFFDAMVSAYEMSARPGCIAGDSFQLRTQIGLGQLRFGNGSAWRQFRGDFLIDDKFEVEIDGATLHSSPDALARDAASDKVIHAEGYTVLRIPASVVFDTPAEAVKRFEEVRRRLSAAA